MVTAFCQAVSQGSRRSSWNTMATREPRPVIVPPCGVSRPASSRSSVVFPQPDGPVRHTAPVAGSSSENPASTGRAGS